MAKIIVIRIRGTVNVSPEKRDTLKMLGLNKTNNARILDSDNVSMMGMIKKVKDFVTWGEISDETEKKLIEKRQPNELNVFNLHPPVKGMKNVKISYPKGDLGYRKEKINELVERMM